MLFYKMVPNLLFFLMAAVLNCSFVLIAIFPLQQNKADNTGKKVKNQIIIDQQGNGNSATIKQTGNNSVQGEAILHVSGKNNRITLSADNQSFRTNANVRGDSNILLWKPANLNQLFSIHLSAGLSSTGSSNHKDYFFTFDHLEEDLLFYQTSRKIIHNH